MNNKTPICNALHNYKSQVKHRYHTPGHAGGQAVPPALQDWNSALWHYDATEVDGLDNLLNESSVILQSEQLTAKLFGADNTLYLTQGSTSGIQIALMSCVKPGEQMLVQRNSHLSVWNSLILSGAKPIWLSSTYNNWGVLEPVLPSTIKEALQSNENIKVVIIQNPTYEGLACDIKEIVSIVHKYNIPLIVDEAHAAHWSFSAKFPASALSAGADLVIQSAHKTLPVLTGGAYLHHQGQLVSVAKLKEFRRIIHSSSPSYLILASLDAAQAYLYQNGEHAYKQLYELLTEFFIKVKRLSSIQLLSLPSKKLDFTKINIKIPFNHIDNCINILKEYGIMFEKSDGNNILFLANLGVNQASLSALYKALFELSEQCNKVNAEKMTVLHLPQFGENIYKPRDILYLQKELVLLKQAKDLVVAEPVLKYPPGVPIILPGEKLTVEMIGYLLSERSVSKLVGLVECNNEVYIKVVK